MNKLISFIFLGCVLSCKNHRDLKDNDVFKTVKIKSDSAKNVDSKTKNIEYIQNYNWQVGFGLKHDIDKDSIWNKPVRFYVDNPNCDKTAIDFYFGKFRPNDSNQTSKLLDLIISDDIKLRPFYRWILNKTILIQDGALVELTGSHARKYAEKFPNEFFEYMDFDTSGEKYSDWSSTITYSGFYLGDDFDKPEIVRQNMQKTMKLNCKNCHVILNKRIEKFALDCFPNKKK